MTPKRMGYLGLFGYNSTYPFIYLFYATSETILEYCKRTREVASELMRGISKSLKLEESYIQKAMDLDLGSQLLVANLYPPCPRPEDTIGLPPHTDHGLMTLLIQNELPGLQVMHNGKWVSDNAPPNSFLVNIGDHMEVHFSGLCDKILTLMKYLLVLIRIILIIPINICA